MGPCEQVSFVDRMSLWFAALPQHPEIYTPPIDLPEIDLPKRVAPEINTTKIGEFSVIRSESIRTDRAEIDARRISDQQDMPVPQQSLIQHDDLNWDNQDNDRADQDDKRAVEDDDEDDECNKDDGEGRWLEVMDTRTGKPYYYNDQTLAVSWTLVDPSRS